MEINQVQTIRLTVNGEERHAAPGQAVLDYLVSLDLDLSRVAVEYNRGILKRPDWDSTLLRNGDHLEIVQFVGGG